jgi:hypothetical protein
MPTYDFSYALNSLKQGCEVTRDGWNGKGLKVAAQIPDENSKMGNPYLYIDATAMGGKLTPWTPSQTDLFAEDWHRVDGETK